MVIAVIAIIAAVAIPNLLNVSAKTIYAKDRRNAQTVAAVASAAKAAGVTNDLSGTDAIQTLQPPGVSVTSAGQLLTFSVSPMSTDEQTGAADHLESSGTSAIGVKLKGE